MAEVVIGVVSETEAVEGEEVTAVVVAAEGTVEVEEAGMEEVDMVVGAGAVGMVVEVVAGDMTEEVREGEGEVGAGTEAATGRVQI